MDSNFDLMAVDEVLNTNITSRNSRKRPQRCPLVVRWSTGHNVLKALGSEGGSELHHNAFTFVWLLTALCCGWCSSAVRSSNIVQIGSIYLHFWVELFWKTPYNNWWLQVWLWMQMVLTDGVEIVLCLMQVTWLINCQQHKYKRIWPDDTGGWRWCRV